MEYDYPTTPWSVGEWNHEQQVNVITSSLRATIKSKKNPMEITLISLRVYASKF